MGLDMYMKSTSKTTDMDSPDLYRCSSEISYWRKNNALNQWFIDMWLDKPENQDKSTEDFNCNKLVLGLEDIEKTIEAIKQNKLEPAPGFFWGCMEYTDEDKKYDLVELQKAVEAVKDGFKVYYTADW